MAKQIVTQLAELGEGLTFISKTHCSVQNLALYRAPIVHLPRARYGHLDGHLGTWDRAGADKVPNFCGAGGCDGEVDNGVDNARQRS